MNRVTVNDTGSELDTLLHQVYGEFLKEWRMEENSNEFGMFGFSSPTIQTVNKLFLSICIPPDEMIRMQRTGRIKSSVDYASFMDLGAFTPCIANQRKLDLKTGTMEINFSYMITDTVEFIKALKERAWHHYNHMMDEQIGEVLNDET